MGNGVVRKRSVFEFLHLLASEPKSTTVERYAVIRASALICDKKLGLGYYSRPA